MNAIATGFLLALTAGLSAQAEPAPIAVTVQGLPERCWLQQRLLLTVWIDVDTAWLRERSVPLFQQQLDQPFHVEVPWLQAAEDRAVVPVPPPAGSTSQRLAVGDRVLAAVDLGPVAAGGRQRLQLQWEWLPLAAGRSAVAPVRLRYAYATRFEQDFLRGRTPVDRQEGSVSSAPAVLLVQALPQPAPTGFGGAVGKFVLSAESAAAARVGTSLPLTLTIAGLGSGSGNLDRLPPLPAPALPGFHVQGVAEASTAAGRRFLLDLVPLRADLTAVPPVPLVTFDPEAGAYATVWSNAVPIAVQPPSPGAALPPRLQALVDAEAARVAASKRWPAWVFGLFAGLLLTIVVWLRRRGNAALRRLRLQHAIAAVSTATTPAAGLAAFDDALAAAAALPQWPGAAGFDRLRALGVSDDRLQNLQGLRHALDGARFGGEAPAAAAVAAALQQLIAR